MHRERLAYQKHTNTANRLEAGYQYLVDVENPHYTDVEDDLLSVILEEAQFLAEYHDVKSICQAI